MKRRYIFLVIVALLWVIVWTWYNATQCYVEEAILVDQYLANYTGCDNCLNIEVVPVNSTGLRIYYFANEHELKPWEHGDVLVIRWCKTIHGYRIRGIKEKG